MKIVYGGRETKCNKLTCPKEKLKYNFAVKVWKTYLYIQNLLFIYQKEWFYIDMYII